MALTDLIPWGRNRTLPAPRQTDEHPFWALRREMDRVFDRMFDSFFRGVDWPGSTTAGWSSGWPHVEVSDTEDHVKLVAELPGLDQKDFDLTFRDGALTLKGEKKTETNGALYSERWHGQFTRTVDVGPDVDPDKIKAEFKNGVLTVTMGKRPQAQREVKRIPISA